MTCFPSNYFSTSVTVTYDETKDDAVYTNNFSLTRDPG